MAAGASALGGRYSFGTAVAQSGSTTTDSTAAGTANAVSTAEATATTSSTCTVLCNRGCSFPGQGRRRYVDANANGPAIEANASETCCTRGVEQS